MFSCVICGETVTSEPDMKAHLIIVHMESEIICPFCKLSGVNYDEMCFHIETAHFEQNELERNFERINSMQYGTSACSSNQPKSSTTSLSSGGTLKHKAFYSENLTESKEFLKSNEKHSKLTKIKGSVYEKTYNPPECPFCGNIEACCQDMEAHMKTKHANLLDTPLEDCDQLLYDCPMCGLICTNYQILQEHVDLHLEESSFEQGMDRDQCSRDLELAHQLQQEEDRKRRAEVSRQEMEEFQKLQRQYGLDNSGGYKQQQLRNMEIEVNRGRMHPSEFHRSKADMMESLAIGIDDGKTKTSGIIEALHRYYQNAATDVRHVWLSTVVDHFHSSLGDKGWGCGYRNFQMLLSSLLQDDAYDDCLKGMSIPCIPKIQSMIEDAWKEGFDPQGASQLNNRLQGTKAWIGACEVYTLLTSLRVKELTGKILRIFLIAMNGYWGISIRSQFLTDHQMQILEQKLCPILYIGDFNVRCHIVDFHKSTGPLGTHPRLFEWILNYYSSEREGTPKVVCTSKPPIYLQHQGHSRTVVGIEERKNRTLCLLIFDPGCPSREMQKLLKQDIEANSLKQLRKFVGNLKHKQYQILAIEGVLSPEEKVARRQASQVFTAEKIP